MHEASDLFKKAISQQNRELRLRVTIEGKEYSGSDIQSCSIEESILIGEDFKFGSATASTFEMTLLNMDESLSAKSFEGKEGHIELGAMMDKFKKPFEFVSMGSFLIEQATKEKSTIKLSGMDKMIFFEKPYVSSLVYPTTLQQILEELCELAGVPLESATFINSDYTVVDKPDLAGVTLRAALEYVSELGCGFAMVNRRGNLEIVTLEEIPLSIDQSNYYSMNLSEYEYGPIDYVVINNEGILEEIGQGTSILEIKDNIFTFNHNEQLLANIYNHVKNFSFKPFTTTWQGNVLTAPGNLINVSYKNGESYKSFIANQKFTFDNGLKCDIATNARTQLQVDFETKGSVTAEVDKVKARIKNLGNEIRLEVEELGVSLAGLVVQVGEVEIFTEELNQSIAAVNVKADNITLSVTDLSGRMGNAETSLSLQAGQIAAKVERNGVIGAINLSPEQAKIQARNIDLVGAVTVLSDISGNLGTITSGTINIYDEIRVGGGIHMRSSAFKVIQMGQDPVDYGSISVNQGTMTIDAGNSISITAPVNFSHTVTGITATAVLG